MMIAYRVVKHNCCSTDEVIGYYFSLEDADKARLAYIEKENLKPGGICCSDANDVLVDTIEIL